MDSVLHKVILDTVMCESADTPISLFVKKETDEDHSTAEVIHTSTTSHKSTNQKLQNAGCNHVLNVGEKANSPVTVHISTPSADGVGGLESFIVKSESSNYDNTGNTNDRNAYNNVRSSSGTVLGIPIIRCNTAEHSANTVATRYHTAENSANNGNKEKVDISGGVIRSQRSFQNCTTHDIVKTGDNSFQCQTCQKPFKSLDTSHHRSVPRSWTRYTDQLKRQRPYKCDKCNESFGWASALVKHRRKHTGEKPFSCEVCDKQFADKQYIRRHMRIHTGEKPFRCEKCGRCFNRKSALTRHIPTHSNLKLRKKRCELEQLNLRQTLLQPREKTFMCEHCGLQLFSQYVLDVHINLFHT